MKNVVVTFPLISSKTVQFRHETYRCVICSKSFARSRSAPVVGVTETNEVDTRYGQFIQAGGHTDFAFLWCRTNSFLSKMSAH